MKKFNVELGMLVRMNKTVVVEVPDEFDENDETNIEELLHKVYAADEGGDFTEDRYSDYCEEAMHCLIEEAEEDKKAQFSLDEETGVVINLGLEDYPGDGGDGE